MGDKYRTAGNGRIALKEGQAEGATSNGGNRGWQDVRGRGRGHTSDGKRERGQGSYRGTLLSGGR